ncbi:WD40 repeat-like protein [Gyrodon lividus]|nr:WD40 repeat-like protein [Gyrodon lividus]
MASRLYDTARNTYLRIKGLPLPPLVLLGQTGWINSVAFLPDGKQVISCSDDNSIRAWSVEDGHEVGHSDWVGSLAFSPDSARLVSGSYDSTVIVWSTTTGERLAGPLKGHSYGVTSVQLSPNGDAIASFSHNGKFIASGSHDATVRLWDATSFTQIGPVLQHNDWVLSVAISPDGSHLVSGGEDHKVRIWTLKGIVLASLLNNTPTSSNDAVSTHVYTCLSNSVDSPVLFHSQPTSVFTSLLVANASLTLTTIS